MRILLHACCGPCAIEPVADLRASGHELTVYYANPNIHPAAEYRRRLGTLLSWARAEGVPVVEGDYDPDSWFDEVGSAFKAGCAVEQRCRLCYRMRLERAAAYAADNGFEGLSTTLAVSPYQLLDVMHEELDRAAAAANVTPVFVDWRPLYPASVRDSKAAGMYRQNYCGCAFSKAEAEAQREEAAHVRAARKAERERRLAPVKAERARQVAERKRRAQEAAAEHARKRELMAKWKAAQR